MQLRSAWSRASERRSIRWLVAACVVALCIGVRRSRAQAPVAAEARSGPELYARYCQLCHGADGTGYAADNAPSLVSPTFLASADDAFIARGIRLGRPNTAMAAYGQGRGGPLDDEQIAKIVDFLRSRGPRAAPLPALKVSGNAKLGASVFRRNCQSCHGTAKQAGKAPQLHNREFLAAASPAFLSYAILHGRPPTKMPAFEKRLSASEVNDVLAWLFSLREEKPAAPRARPVVPDDLPFVIHPKGGPPDFTLREGRFVSAEQVKRALDAKRRLIIVDARSPSDWIQYHIPGAVPIPYYDTAKLERVPNDGTWVVAYCACPHHASGEVVDALRKRNFPNTAVLDEGILFWRTKGYALRGEDVPPPAAKKKAAQR